MPRLFKRTTRITIPLLKLVFLGNEKRHPLTFWRIKTASIRKIEVRNARILLARGALLVERVQVPYMSFESS